MNVQTLQRRLAPVLRPAAALYGMAMRIRASRYAGGNAAAHRYRANCPVISVGNISWGGTGKTPLVDYLLATTREMSLNTIVLTRGYKAAPPSFPYIVTPGDTPAVAGDEPLLLAHGHPEATVIVDAKRSRAAAWAERERAPDLFILDDGMQHLAMQRDLDIVLLKPEDLLDGWNKVMPSGTWRESFSALGRAHAFCIKADEAVFSGIAPVAANRLAAFERPLFSFDLQATHLTRLQANRDDTPETTQNLNGVPYTLLLGTGNPAQVHTTATKFLGIPPAYEHILPDHHHYTEADVKKAASHGCPIICTAKDAVKLTQLLPSFGNVPVWILTVHVAFGPTLFTSASFATWWQGQWRALSCSRQVRP